MRPRLEGGLARGAGPERSCERAPIMRKGPGTRGHLGVALSCRGGAGAAIASRVPYLSSRTGRSREVRHGTRIASAAGLQSLSASFHGPARHAAEPGGPAREGSQERATPDPPAARPHRPQGAATPLRASRPSHRALLRREFELRTAGSAPSRLPILLLARRARCARPGARAALGS